MSTMTKRYTAAELDALPTLRVAQADNLKVDTGTERVWLSRLHRADGMKFENTVTVERYNGHQWLTVEEYDGGAL